MIFQNKTLILASTLAFLVCSSDSMIIYDEQIVVALSFLFFVLFSFYSFQDSVKMTCDERRKAIMQELEQMLVSKAETIQKLQSTYQQSVQLVASCETLKKAALEELEISQQQRIKAFESSVQKKCVQKLQQILSLEKQFQHELHNKIQRNFQQSVLHYFQKHQETLTSQLFDQACMQLKK